MKRLLITILLLASNPIQLIRADDQEEVRKVATAMSDAMAKKDWGAVFEQWGERVKMSNTWEAFFEASFAIETKQRWKGEAEKLLAELYEEEAAEKELEAARKKKPRLPDDEEIKIVLKHISDHKKLWAGWMKVMNKDAPAPPRHDFAGASIELMGNFARLSDGDIELYFKKEEGAWKFTVEEIEPDLQKKIEKAARGVGRQPDPAPEPNSGGKTKPAPEQPPE